MASFKYLANDLLMYKGIPLFSFFNVKLIFMFSGCILYISSDLITSLFSNNTVVIDYGSKYLKICAFIIPAYPIFFLSNGLFMAIKKSENAMISNIFRNCINPIIVFLLAQKINADFETFFWMWAVINWIFSGLYFSFLIYYINYKLEKFSTVINPQP